VTLWRNKWHHRAIHLHSEGICQQITGSSLSMRPARFPAFTIAKNNQWPAQERSFCSRICHLVTAACHIGGNGKSDDGARASEGSWHGFSSRRDGKARIEVYQLIARSTHFKTFFTKLHTCNPTCKTTGVHEIIASLLSTVFPVPGKSPKSCPGQFESIC